MEVVRLPGAAGRADRRAFVEQVRAAARQRDLQERVRQEVERMESGAPRPSAWRTFRRLVYRGRRILAPVGLLAVLGVAGLVASAPGVAVGAAPGVWLLAAAAWWGVRGRSRVARGRERRYTAACVAAGAVWLVLAGLLGVGTVDGFLVAGWAAASCPWWVRHWPRDRPAVEPEPEEVPADTVADLWEANVADVGGPAPGSWLFDPEITEHGQAWKVQLKPGRQALEDLQSGLPRIATGLRKPMERIVIDGCPTTEDPSIARMQLIMDSPIQETVYFECPRWDGGKVLLGPHADGLGEACWRVYSAKSMWSGFILGGTGSGKSRTLEMIAVVVRAMYAEAGIPVMIVYIDGQDGASSPTLWKYASVKGGPAEAPAILSALEHGLRSRQKWNRVFGLAGATAGECPDGADEGLVAVLTIVDECHAVFLPEYADRWANLAREMRKGLMGIIASDQHSGLEVFGNNEALRSSLLMGNGVALRTTSRMAGHMLPNLAIDPYDFPDLPGYGYKIAARGSGERTAPYRARYLPDREDAAKAAAGGTELPVATVEDWFERYPDAPLDQMTARAFGDVYLRRHEMAAASTEAARAEIEGRTPPPAPEGAAPGHEASPPAEPAPVSPIVAEADESDEVNGTTREQILALLAKHGTLRRGKLDELIEKHPSSVKQALRKLHEEGQIDRGSNGYSLVQDAGRPAA